MSAGEEGRDCVEKSCKGEGGGGGEGRASGAGWDMGGTREEGADICHLWGQRSSQSVGRGDPQHEEVCVYCAQERHCLLVCCMGRPPAMPFPQGLSVGDAPPGSTPLLTTRLHTLYTFTPPTVRGPMDVKGRSASSVKNTRSDGSRSTPKNDACSWPVT